MLVLLAIIEGQDKKIWLSALTWDGFKDLFMTMDGISAYATLTAQMQAATILALIIMVG
jgi:hypothetical protein